MYKRTNGRTNSQVRPIQITPKYLIHPMGSALIEIGQTRVLCSASIDDGIPAWMRMSGLRGQGWLTAEYSMLPGATSERNRRERQNVSGRTQEIQRLIGRSLRSIIDLKQIGERTITIDCDVLQADGGTRTTSITGAYIALRLALENLLKTGKIKTNPLKDSVCAISVGIIEDNVLVDLDYQEDMKAEVDLNVVMTSGGQLLEVQGTAEKRPFSRDQLNKMLDAASGSLQEIFNEQNAVFG